MLSRAPAEKGSFCPQKERYWSIFEPIFDNFSNPANHLTWPDHGSQDDSGALAGTVLIG